MRTMVSLVIAALAMTAVANTSWYRNTDTFSQNANYLKDMSYWSQGSATGTAGSGAPTSGDDLFHVGLMGSKNRLRTYGTFTFGGNSLTIGDTGNSNEMCHDSGVITFPNDGLRVVKGNWWFNWASSSSGGIGGKITVHSPAASPFVFHVGQEQYSNHTVNVQAAIHGAAGTGVRFGNASGLVGAPRITYSLSGGIDDFAGELSVQIASKFKMTADDCLSRVDLKSGTASPATITLGYGATLSETGNGGTVQVGTINFNGNPCRLELKCLQQNATAFIATNAVTFAAGAKVYVGLTTSVPSIYEGDRLAVLTAPATSTFTESNFEIMFSPMTESSRLSLEVEATDTERTLYLVSSEPRPTALWYLKENLNDSSKRPFENMKYWKDVDGNAGEDTAFDTAAHYTIGSNYRVRLTGTTVFSGQRLMLGEGEGYGEVVHDGGTVELQNDGAYLRKGGWWFNMPLDMSVSGKMTVSSTAASPFSLFYGQVAHSNHVATVAGPIVGAAGTQLWVGKSSIQMSAWSPRQTIELGDIDGFAGTISVFQLACYDNGYRNFNQGDDFGTCLRLPVDRTASPCTVNVQFGGNVAPAGSGTAKVGTLSFAEGSRLQVWGTEGGALGCVEATNTLSIAAAVRPLPVYWRSFVRKGTGSCRDAILRAPADKSDFTIDDFTLILGGKCYNTDARLEVEVDLEHNVRTLYMVTIGIVEQIATYPGEESRDQAYPSSLTNAAAWSDNAVPHAGSRYLTAMPLRTLHTPNVPYVFPGESLRVQSGGGIYAVSSTFEVPELVMDNGSRLMVCQRSYAGTRFVTTNITVNGWVGLKSHSSHLLELVGPISGYGMLVCGCDSGTGIPKSDYMFTGDNRGYLGKILITMGEYRDEYISLEDSHSSLYVNGPYELGGAMPAFDYSALELTHLSALAVTNTAGPVTLSAGLNRGLFAFEKAQFYVASGATLDLGWPVTLRGQLWKCGAGTVILRGEMKHLTSDDGTTLTDTPTAGSNLLHVANGTLRIAHPDALTGLKVDFAEGTSLEVAYTNGCDFATRGIDLTKLDGTIALASGLAGKLPWAVDADGADEPLAPRTEMALATVNAADAETYRAMFRGAVTRRTWTDMPQRLIEKTGDGTVTFKVQYNHQGTMVIFR